jgi:transketolase
MENKMEWHYLPMTAEQYQMAVEEASACESHPHQDPGSHAQESGFVFLTGDLGFMVLEPLRDVAKERFINAGIAEQNMVSVAAGLAHAGLRPWVYSIAPFIYARAFEQIRNDICMHDLPVFLVGNGGGYAYGVMGPTHHAIEDYGALLGLPNLTVYVPAFAADVARGGRAPDDGGRPAYLRLGRDEKPEISYGADPTRPGGESCRAEAPRCCWWGRWPAASWPRRKPCRNRSGPSLWVLSELPIAPAEIPAAFIADFEQSGHLVVVEEHVAQGSAGASSGACALRAQGPPRRFTHRFRAWLSLRPLRLAALPSTRIWPGPGIHP